MVYPTGSKTSWGCGGLSAAAGTGVCIESGVMRCRGARGGMWGWVHIKGCGAGAVVALRAWWLARSGWSALAGGLPGLPGRCEPGQALSHVNACRCAADGLASLKIQEVRGRDCRRSCGAEFGADACRDGADAGEDARAGEIGERIFRIGQVRLVGDGVGVEVLRPTGDICICPIPKRQHHKIFANTGFCFTCRFSKHYLTGDSLTYSKDTHKIGVEEHTIGKITKFLVYIKSLGSHIDFYMVMALKFEEVADTRLKYLIVAVVPNHANFINKEQRLTGGNKITKMLYIKMTHAGHHQFFHVSIDKPTPFKVLLRQFDEVCGLARAFLAEHKIEFIGIDISAGSQMPHHHKAEEAAKESQ